MYLCITMISSGVSISAVCCPTSMDRSHQCGARVFLYAHTCALMRSGQQLITCQLQIKASLHFCAAVFHQPELSMNSEPFKGKEWKFRLLRSHGELHSCLLSIAYTDRGCHTSAQSSQGEASCSGTLRSSASRSRGSN